MIYTKREKLRYIDKFQSKKLSISAFAFQEQIPKQTLARWIRLHKRFGGIALENRKPGTKEVPINAKFELLVLNMWQKKKRSAYKMRKDLERDKRRNGYDISERQIKRIYKKHKLRKISSNVSKEIQM